MLLLYLIALTCINNYVFCTNNQPIIGILTQETYILTPAIPFVPNQSYIAASYVKYLEAGGARVVPIWIGQEPNYYKKMIKYTNGLLLPGGATYFNETAGYGTATKLLYKYALNQNRKQISHYPIMGICLGMQALLYADANGIDIRTKCQSSNVALNLNLTANFNRSRLLNQPPSSPIIQSLINLNVTYNQHRYCITDGALKQYNLTGRWRIIARNYDQYNTEFISLMEHRKYPFYGLQFHPEKNSYEFKSGRNIPHSRAAIEVGQYFANFFVEETRRNANKFPEGVTSTLIYHYPAIYTGNITSFEQIYLFATAQQEY